MSKDGFTRLEEIQADMIRQYGGISRGYISDKARAKARKKHKKKKS